MGFTKKTWLALALAIVLVLGLSVSASAAGEVFTFGSNGTKIFIGATDGTGTTSFTLKDSSGTAITPTAATLKSGSTATAATASIGGNTVTVSPGTIVGTAVISVTYTPAAGGAITVDSPAITVVKDPTLAFDPAAIGTTAQAIKVGSAAAGKLEFQITNELSEKVTSGLTVVGASGIVELTAPATVNDKWVVTPKSFGSVTLKMTRTVEGKTVTLNSAIITVTIPAGIQLNPSADKDMVLPATGTPATYEFTVEEFNVTGTALAGAEVTSSKPTVATVSAEDATTHKFTVTPKAVGETTITAKLAGYTATFKVNVYDATKAKSIAIDKAVGSKTGKLADDTAFAVIPTADDATQKLDFVAGENRISFKSIVTLGDNTTTGDRITDPKVTWTVSPKANAEVVKQAVWTQADVTDGAKKDDGTTVVVAADVGKPKHPSVTEIIFKKAGTVKLTASVDGVKRTLTFTVTNKAATSINSIADTTMVKAQYKQVKPVTVPADARVNLTFTSKNTKVATVNKTSGVIKAVKNGTTTITVKDSISKKSVSFKVTVGTDYSKIKFAGIVLSTAEKESATPTTQQNWINSKRALKVLENVSYDGKLHDNNGHIAYARTDTNVTDQVDWDQSVKVDSETALFDLINEVKYEVLEGTADPTKEYASDDDVFWFIFAGDVDSNGDIVVQAARGNEPAKVVTFEKLTAKLAEIPGTVVMILDCKASSQVLTTKGGASLSPSQVNRKIINTVAKKDSQLKSKTIGTAATTAGSYKQKFKVITSTSKKSQDSGRTVTTYTGDGAMPEGTVSFTEYWFVDALVSGLNPYSSLSKMPADANNNRVVTLKELYNYMNKYVNAQKAAAKKAGVKISQTVSVYPSKSDAFPVYARLMNSTFTK